MKRIVWRVLTVMLLWPTIGGAAIKAPAPWFAVEPPPEECPYLALRDKVCHGKDLQLRDTCVAMKSFTAVICRPPYPNSSIHMTVGNLMVVVRVATPHYRQQLIASVADLKSRPEQAAEQVRQVMEAMEAAELLWWPE